MKDSKDTAVKAVIYRDNGGPEVLELVDRDLPSPGPGEVRVRVAASGVNPTDVRARAGVARAEDFPGITPHHDGAGTIDAVGDGVDPRRVGRRVWLFMAAAGRPTGTAAEFTVVPADRAVPLPDRAGFDLGVAIGVPALTAHRALTVAEDGPHRLRPGALKDEFRREDFTDHRGSIQVQVLGPHPDLCRRGGRLTAAVPGGTGPR